MKTTLAAISAGAMLFGFVNLASAAETEAPGAHSDITIVQSTPGEKGGQPTSAPSADDQAMDKKDKAASGSEGASNKGNPPPE